MASWLVLGALGRPLVSAWHQGPPVTPGRAASAVLLAGLAVVLTVLTLTLAVFAAETLRIAVALLAHG